MEEQPGVVKQGNKKVDEVVNLLRNNWNRYRHNDKNNKIVVPI